MKIQGSNSISSIAGSIQVHRPRLSSAAAGQRDRVTQRFDSVSIGEAAGRNSFQMALQSRLTQEVRASVTPGRLSALSQEIENGTYEPDAMSIARRMMLLTEEA